MKIDEKNKKVILISVSIIYAAMFVCAVACSYWTYSIKKQLCDGKCHCTCQQCESNQKKVKNIDECLKILAPAKDAKGQCEVLALSDSTQVGNINSYTVAQKKEIPAETLQKIIDKKFYCEAGDVVNYGIYNPAVRLTFSSEKGKKVVIIYSFANAQFNLYCDNKLVKEGRLDNIDELEKLLN